MGFTKEHLCKPMDTDKVWGLTQGGERMGLGGGEEREKKWEQLLTA